MEESLDKTRCIFLPLVRLWKKFFFFSQKKYYLKLFEQNVMCMTVQKPTMRAQMTKIKFSFQFPLNKISFHSIVP